LQSSDSASADRGDFSSAAVNTMLQRVVANRPFSTAKSLLDDRGL
jgi:hypothetical protein